MTRLSVLSPNLSQDKANEAMSGLLNHMGLLEEDLYNLHNQLITFGKVSG